MDDFGSFEDFAEFLPSGAQRWKMAEEMSVALVRSKGSEDNVDPLKRIKIESLARVAELNVAEVLDLDVSSVKLVPTTRENLARDTLKSYKPFFEALENSKDLVTVLPIVTILTFATGVGNLALTALSSYEILAPRTPNSKEILVAASSVDEFSKEWSLDDEDFWVWMCLSVLSTHAVISTPHIHKRISELIMEFAGAFEPASDEALGQLMEKLFTDQGEFLNIENPNMENLAEMEPRIMEMVSNEPELLMGAQVSELQESISQELGILIAVVRGLSQYVLDTALEKIFGEKSHLAHIREAVIRRQSLNDPAVNLVSRLMGVDMSAQLRDLGNDFISGVLERNKEDALHKLLESEEGMPTTAELAAPGLWLARIEAG